MPISLPASIANYFSAANAGDAQRAAGCFSDDATVFDEGATIRGQAGIVAWLTSTRDKYGATLTPLNVENVEAAPASVLVRVQVEGHFKGSPVTLACRFTLAGTRIIKLDINA